MGNDTANRDWRWWTRVIVFGRSPQWTLVRIVVLIITVFVTWKFIIRPMRVEGPSMSPTCQERSIKFLNRLAYLRHEPRRYDVVAIRFTGESIMLMKRIVALPGEKVEFIEGKLYINDKPLEEPYLRRPCRWSFAPEQPVLGPDEYYVVGDNRAMPEENHTKGIVRRAKIVGKVIL